MTVPPAYGDWQLEVLDRTPRHASRVAGFWDGHGYWQVGDWHLATSKDFNGLMVLTQYTYSLEKCVQIWHHEGYCHDPGIWRIRNTKTNEIIPCAAL